MSREELAGTVAADTQHCQVLHQVGELLHLGRLGSDLLVLGLHHLPKQIHSVVVETSRVRRQLLGQSRCRGLLWWRSQTEVLRLLRCWSLAYRG